MKGLRPSDSSRATRASTSGSFGGGNGSLSISTHCKASPGTSMPSQKLAEPTSTEAGWSMNCCSNWRFGMLPWTSTSMRCPPSSKRWRKTSATVCNWRKVVVRMKVRPPSRAASRAPSQPTDSP